MAIIAAILGPSGDGKTTSTIINADGDYDLSEEGYKGMDPRRHYILNLDRKSLPFPAGMWGREFKNYAEPSNFKEIKMALEHISKREDITSVSIDTINIYLALKEFNDRKRMTHDQWKDVANDVIELNHLCNTLLRNDQIAYIFGHTMLQTQVDGSEKMVFSVIGKKLTKTQPEGFYPIVLMTRLETGDMGDNKYYFQTKAQNSSAKTPIGMFDKFEIPNSLKLVDDNIRKYYRLPVIETNLLEEIEIK